LLHERYFGSAVNPIADLILLLEIGMGAGLLLGAMLARMGKFRLHAWCQSAIVLLNLLLIVFTMVPSFHQQVSPRIPEKLGKSYYAIATSHAVLGSIAEIAGLYLMLAAGTNVLPKRLQLRRYKLWMRSVLVLWWIALLLGVTTYARWYRPQIFRR
jgi:uncharacterized membrane protein YozB (DUF420 family)